MPRHIKENQSCFFRYVEWSMHEPEFDQWVWDGDADIVDFIKIAQEEDLFVILRPGPYICAERDFVSYI